jgi:hypothetical protein
MLTRRNAIEISDTRFHEDVDRFIRVLDNVLGVSKPASVLPQTTPRRLSGGLCLLAGITVSVVLVVIIGVLAYLAEWIGNGEEIDTGASLVTQQATDIPTSTPSSTNTSTLFPTSTDTPDQPTPTSTDSPTPTLIPSSTNTAKPPTNTPTPVPTPTDTPKPPTPTLSSISGSSNSESIRVQQGQLLILANDDGAAVIKLTFGEGEASYQWRYLRTGSVSEQTGEGIVYENYARTPTADGNLIVDLGSELFIEIEDLRVEWSFSGNTSGWIYYIPGTLEVQVLSERDFETFDLSTVQL